MESNSNNSVSMLVGTKRTVSLTADGSVYKKYGIYLKKCNFDLKVDGSSYKMKFFVDRVDPNSQAYQAGIVSGDVILTVTSDVSPIARRHSTSSGSSTTSGKSTSGKKRGKGSTASSSSGMAVDSNKYDSSVLCPALNKQTYYVNNNDLGKFEEFLEQNNEITLTVIYVNAREWNRLVEGKERLEKEYREKEMSLKAVEYHLYALQNPGCSYLDFNNSSASLQSSLFTQSNPPRRSIDAQFSLPNGAKNASQFRDRLISEPGKLQKTSLSRSQPNMLNKESTKQWFPKFLMSKARKESTGSNKSIDRSTDGGALLKASISKSDRHFQASVGDNYSIDSGVGSRGRTESPFNSEAQSVRSTRRPLGDNTDTSSLCSSTPGNAKIFRSPSSMNRSPDVSNKELNSLAGGVTLPRFRNKTPVKCNPEVMHPSHWKIATQLHEPCREAILEVSL
ncbi:uncharacterized protein LOC134846307 isoform X2 [Symsagittifera roscoffensis]|uniref:uncharacterized protein LOC134846307 isoform X2 n=1 Tax=Symsagittifera roscoffensis TaxID=84072 RepID=UPI00307BCA15